jgi:hypothetical protein
MSDDFRPFWLLTGVLILYGGIVLLYIPAIITGGLLALGLGSWLGIDYYKVFRELRKK